MITEKDIKEIEKKEFKNSNKTPQYIVTYELDGEENKIEFGDGKYLESTEKLTDRLNEIQENKEKTMKKLKKVKEERKEIDLNKLKKE